MTGRLVKEGVTLCIILAEVLATVWVDKTVPWEASTQICISLGAMAHCGIHTAYTAWRWICREIKHD